MPVRSVALILMGLTATSAAIAAAPKAAGHWWEKVIVTVPAGGDARCTFASSRETSKQCVVEASQMTLADAAPENGQTTTIIFERRFTPAGMEADTKIGAGELLLGGQVLKLAIGADGKVEGCRVAIKAEGMAPDYDCDDVTGEVFPAGNGGEATLAVLIYAHSENLA